MISLASRLCALYLAAWVFLFLLNPALVANWLYGVELTPALQKSMTNNVFLRASLVCLFWYMPYLPHKVQVSFAYFAGGFWLISSVALLMIYLLQDYSGATEIVVIRMLVGGALSILFLGSARLESIKEETKSTV